MNPLFERKLYFSRYAAACVLFGAAYAASFGFAAGMDAATAAVDWAVFTVVAGFEGLALWSLLKYGADSAARKSMKTGYYVTVGILFTGAALGAESLAVWLAAPEIFPQFARTLPGRSLVLAPVFASYVLYYVYAVRSSDEDEGSDGHAAAKPEPAGTDALERITIKGGQKIKVITVGEIIYLQAEGDYVAVVTSEGRFLKEQTMKYFEENLPAGEFVRVHRSCIVSVSNISRIEQSGREHSVVLRDATRIRLSDTGYKLLRSVLGL